MTNEERHTAAIEALREAETELHVALAKLHSATVRWVRAEAAVSGDRATAALAGIAASNNATWSGGLSAAANIIENSKRRAALDLLRITVR